MTNEQIKAIHTVVLPKFCNEHVVLFTSTTIYSVNLKTGVAEQKYTSFNLQPYNIQIINSKYLYFQSLDGICLLNLKAVVHQAQA
jgi:hypothetical protein